MSKDRRTVSIDPDVEEYLAREGVCASTLVNKLVKNHITAGGDKLAMLELREEQLLSDIRELEGRVEEKENELERVRNDLEEYRSFDEQTLEQKAALLDGTPLEKTNTAVKNHAQDIGMDVERFIEEIENRR